MKKINKISQRIGKRANLFMENERELTEEEKKKSEEGWAKLLEWGKNQEWFKSRKKRI